MEDQKAAIARLLLRLGAVTLSPDKLFTFDSGIQSPIYCDNRILMAHPAERKQITEGFLHAIREHAIACDTIAGVATGGIPHAAWLAAALDAPMLYIRPKPKDHGKQNQIEGKLGQGQRVLVIEDLISSGGSSVSAIEAVRAAGGIVEHCLAIFTYGFSESGKRFGQANCTLHTLTDFPTLLAVAKAEGRITEEQERKLQTFAADPRGWHV